MIAFVDHGLGQVERGETFCKALIAEQRLVHARAAWSERRIEHIVQAAQDVIGVEHGIFGNLLQPVRPVAEDIGERPREHAHLAMERGHSAEVLQRPAEMFLGELFRVLFLDQVDDAVLGPRRVGQRSERSECFGKDHRARARAAAAMRRGKGLVQIDMHRIHAEIAGADLADDGVEVRPIAIDETARRMDRVGDRLHVALEQAARIRIGNHHARDIGAKPRLERFQIDAAFGGRGNVFHLVTGEGGGRGIGPVGAFRHQDHLARIAPRFECGANAQDAAQFAMGARLRAHGDGVHAGEIDEPVSEFIDDFERTAHRVDRLQRMHVGKARHARDLFVEPRIVLHRARAQRKKTEVDRVILPRQARVMTDGFRFGQARQADRLAPLETAKPVRPAPGLRQVHTGRLDMADLEQQRLFQHQRAIAGGRIGTAHRVMAFDGCAGLPARCIGRAHASTSSSAEASVSMSSSVVVSVTATSSPFARFWLPGNRRPSDTPARTPSSAS